MSSNTTTSAATRRTSTAIEDGNSAAIDAIRGDTALTILHAVNSLTLADENSAGGNRDEKGGGGDGNGELRRTNSTLSVLLEIGESDMALDEYKAACFTTWEMLQTSKGRDAAVEAFSLNSDIQARGSLGAADMRKMCVPLVGGSNNTPCNNNNKNKKKDTIYQHESSSYTKEDAFGPAFTAALDDRAVEIVTEVENAHIPIEFSSRPPTPKSNKGGHDDDYNPAETKQILSENSFIETSDLVYVRIWKSRREGRKFQSAFKHLARTRAELLLGSGGGLFGVPHSVSVAYQGKLVTVTWLVPLMEEWPVKISTAFNNAMTSGSAITPSKATTTTSAEGKTSSSSPTAAPSLLGQVEACWRIALGIPLTSATASAAVARRRSSMGGLTAAGGAADNMNATATKSNPIPLPIFLGADGRYYVVAVGEIFKKKCERVGAVSSSVQFTNSNTSKPSDRIGFTFGGGIAGGGVNGINNNNSNGNDPQMSSSTTSLPFTSPLTAGGSSPPPAQRGPRRTSFVPSGFAMGSITDASDLVDNDGNQQQQNNATNTSALSLDLGANVVTTANTSAAATPAAGNITIAHENTKTSSSSSYFNNTVYNPPPNTAGLFNSTSTIGTAAHGINSKRFGGATVDEPFAGTTTHQRLEFQCWDAFTERVQKRERMVAANQRRNSGDTCTAASASTPKNNNIHNSGATNTNSVGFSAAALQQPSQQSQTPATGMLDTQHQSLLIAASEAIGEVNTRHLYTAIYDRVMRVVSYWLQSSDEDALPETEIDLFSSLFKAAGLNMRYLHHVRHFVEERFQSEKWTVESLYTNPTTSSFSSSSSVAAAPSVAVASTYEEHLESVLLGTPTTSSSSSSSLPLSPSTASTYPQLNTAVLHNPNATIYCIASAKAKFLALIDEEMACRTVLSVVEAAMLAAAAGPNNTVLTSVDFGRANGANKTKKKKNLPENDGGDLDAILNAANEVITELRTNEPYFKKDMMMVLRCKFHAPANFSLNLKDLNLQTISYFVSDRLGLSFDEEENVFTGFEAPIALSNTGRAAIAAPLVVDGTQTVDAEFSGEEENKKKQQRRRKDPSSSLFSNPLVMAHHWKELLVASLAAKEPHPFANVASIMALYNINKSLLLNGEKGNNNGNNSNNHRNSSNNNSDAAAAVLVDRLAEFLEITAASSVASTAAVVATTTKGINNAITTTTTMAYTFPVNLIDKFIAKIAMVRLGDTNVLMNGGAASGAAPSSGGGGPNLSNNASAVKALMAFASLSSKSKGGTAAATPGSPASPVRSRWKAAIAAVTAVSKVAGLWYNVFLMTFGEALGMGADNSKILAGDVVAAATNNSNLRKISDTVATIVGGTVVNAVSSSPSYLPFTAKELSLVLIRRELALLSNLPYLSASDAALVCDRSFSIYLFARQANIVLTNTEHARLLKVWAGATTLGHEVYASASSSSATNRRGRGNKNNVSTGSRSSAFGQSGNPTLLDQIMMGTTMASNKNNSNNNQNAAKFTATYTSSNTFVAALFSSSAMGVDVSDTATLSTILTTPDPMAHIRSVGRSFAFFATLPQNVNGVIMNTRYITLRRDLIAALAIAAGGCEVDFSEKNPDDVAEIGEDILLAGAGSEGGGSVSLSFSGLQHTESMAVAAREGRQMRSVVSTVTRGIIQTAAIIILAYFDDLLAIDPTSGTAVSRTIGIGGGKRVPTSVPLLPSSSPQPSSPLKVSMSASSTSPHTNRLIASPAIAGHCCDIVSLLDDNGYAIAMGLAVMVAAKMGIQLLPTPEEEEEENGDDVGAPSTPAADGPSSDSSNHPLSLLVADLEECRYAFANVSDAQDYNDSLIACGEKHLDTLERLIPAINAFCDDLTSKNKRMILQIQKLRRQWEAEMEDMDEEDEEEEERRNAANNTNGGNNGEYLRNVAFIKKVRRVAEAIQYFVTVTLEYREEEAELERAENEEIEENNYDEEEAEEGEVEGDGEANAVDDNEESNAFPSEKKQHREEEELVAVVAPTKDSGQKSPPQPTHQRRVSLRRGEALAMSIMASSMAAATPTAAKKNKKKKSGGPLNEGDDAEELDDDADEIDLDDEEDEGENSFLESLGFANNAAIMTEKNNRSVEAVLIGSSSLARSGGLGRANNVISPTAAMRGGGGGLLRSPASASLSLAAGGGDDNSAVASGGVGGIRRRTSNAAVANASSSFTAVVPPTDAFSGSPGDGSLIPQQTDMTGHQGINNNKMDDDKKDPSCIPDPMRQSMVGDVDPSRELIHNDDDGDEKSPSSPPDTFRNTQRGGGNAEEVAAVGSVAEAVAGSAAAVAIAHAAETSACLSQQQQQRPTSASLSLRGNAASGVGVNGALRRKHTASPSTLLRDHNNGDIVVVDDEADGGEEELSRLAPTPTAATKALAANTTNINTLPPRAPPPHHRAPTPAQQQLRRLSLGGGSSLRNDSSFASAAAGSGIGGDVSAIAGEGGSLNPNNPSSVAEGSIGLGGTAMMMGSGIYNARSRRAFGSLGNGNNSHQKGNTPREGSPSPSVSTTQQQQEQSNSNGVMHVKSTTNTETGATAAGGQTPVAAASVVSKHASARSSRNTSVDGSAPAANDENGHGDGVDGVTRKNIRRNLPPRRGSSQPVSATTSPSAANAPLQPPTSADPSAGKSPSAAGLHYLSGGNAAVAVAVDPLAVSLRAAANKKAREEAEAHNSAKEMLLLQVARLEAEERLQQVLARREAAEQQHRERLQREREAIEATRRRIEAAAAEALRSAAEAKEMLEAARRIRAEAIAEAAQQQQREQQQSNTDKDGRLLDSMGQRPRNSHSTAAPPSSSSNTARGSHSSNNGAVARTASSTISTQTINPDGDDDDDDRNNIDQNHGDGVNDGNHEDQHDEHGDASTRVTTADAGTSTSTPPPPPQQQKEEQSASHHPVVVVDATDAVELAKRQRLQQRRMEKQQRLVEQEEAERHQRALQREEDKKFFAVQRSVADQLERVNASWLSANAAAQDILAGRDEAREAKYRALLAEAEEATEALRQSRAAAMALLSDPQLLAMEDGGSAHDDVLRGSADSVSTVPALASSAVVGSTSHGDGISGHGTAAPLTVTSSAAGPSAVPASEDARRCDDDDEEVMDDDDEAAAIIAAAPSNQGDNDNEIVDETEESLAGLTEPEREDRLRKRELAKVKRQHAALQQAIHDQILKAAEWKAKLAKIDQLKSEKVAKEKQKFDDEMCAELAAQEAGRAIRRQIVSDEALLRGPNVADKEIIARLAIEEAFRLALPLVSEKEQLRIKTDAANERRRRLAEEEHNKILAKLQNELRSEETILSDRMATVRRKLEADERLFVERRESEDRFEHIEEAFAQGLADLADLKRAAETRLRHKERENIRIATLRGTIIPIPTTSLNNKDNNTSGIAIARLLDDEAKERKIIALEGRYRWVGLIEGFGIEARIMAEQQAEPRYYLATQEGHEEEGEASSSPSSPAAPAADPPSSPSSGDAVAAHLVMMAGSSTANGGRGASAAVGAPAWKEEEQQREGDSSSVIANYNSTNGNANCQDPHQRVIVDPSHGGGDGSSSTAVAMAESIAVSPQAVVEQGAGRPQQQQSAAAATSNTNEERSQKHHDADNDDPRPNDDDGNEHTNDPQVEYSSGVATRRSNNPPSTSTHANQPHEQQPLVPSPPAAHQPKTSTTTEEDGTTAKNSTPASTVAAAGDKRQLCVCCGATHRVFANRRGHLLKPTASSDATLSVASAAVDDHHHPTLPPQAQQLSTRHVTSADQAHATTMVDGPRGEGEEVSSATRKSMTAVVNTADTTCGTAAAAIVAPSPPPLPANATTVTSSPSTSHHLRMPLHRQLQLQQQSQQQQVAIVATATVDEGSDETHPSTATAAQQPSSSSLPHQPVQQQQNQNSNFIRYSYRNNAFNVDANAAVIAAGGPRALKRPPHAPPTVAVAAGNNSSSTGGGIIGGAAIPLAFTSAADAVHDGQNHRQNDDDGSGHHTLTDNGGAAFGSVGSPINHLLSFKQQEHQQSLLLQHQTDDDRSAARSLLRKLRNVGNTSGGGDEQHHDDGPSW